MAVGVSHEECFARAILDRDPGSRELLFPTREILGREGEDVSGARVRSPPTKGPLEHQNRVACPKPDRAGTVPLHLLEPEKPAVELPRHLEVPDAERYMVDAHPRMVAGLRFRRQRRTMGPERRLLFHDEL